MKREKQKGKKKNTIASKMVGLLGATTTGSLVAEVITFVVIASIFLTVIVALICTVMTVITIVESVITGITGIDFSNTGNNASNIEMTVGAEYEWNVQDLEKMPDAWSKNLYRLAWLATENKKAQGSDMPVSLLMGIPVLETGNMFFPTGDDNGRDAISGVGKNWNNYSITEYATVGGAFPYNITYDYITGLYATDASLLSKKAVNKATWGSVPHAETLKTDTLGTQHKTYINNYADGDVNNSVYSVPVALANTIYMYETYTDTIFDKDAEYGNAHKYKKYWEAACKRYGVNPQDVQLRQQAYVSMYYLIHAGGVWSYKDIADDFYYAIMDYIVYVCTQITQGDLNSIKILSVYDEQGTTVKGDLIRTLNGNVLRAGIRGNANLDHYSASSWQEPSITKAYFGRETIEGMQEFDKSFIEMWMTYNMANDGEKLNQAYIRAYVHENKTLVRQATYAASLGCTSVFVGNARLDYIFGILNKEYTINWDTGNVCYAGSASAGTSGAVTTNYRAGTFDTVNSAKSGYSNYRDATWFAQINPSEWSNPLSPNINGGFSVSSRYGYRYLDGNNPWDWHSGIDLVYKVKSQDLSVLRSAYGVYAMHDGEICYVNTDTANSGGRYIHYKVTYLRNGEYVTRYITYMHLSGFTPEIEQAIAVQLNGKARGSVKIPIMRGNKIAYMGGSGSVAGVKNEFGYAVHLHISLSNNPIVNGKVGRLDIETELPFVTTYDGYTNWWNTTNGYSGYLKQKPASNITANQADPQAK